jgi:transcriptional regulator GlxA family with amidase domain
MIAVVQIAVVLFPRITVLDAIGPYEVLSRLPGAEVVFVAADKAEHRSDNGFLGLMADATFEEVTAPDVVVVPGGYGTRPLIGDPTVCGWLRAVHERTTYTTSVCTGSLLLASAGLLDGIDATTHWASLELLGQLGARPVTQRVVERGKILTAAGVSSGIDMALRLAALLADDLTAQAIQLQIEYDPQPPFDTGSLAKAGPEVADRLRELTAARR